MKASRKRSTRWRKLRSNWGFTTWRASRPNEGRLLPFPNDGGDGMKLDEAQNHDRALSVSSAFAFVLILGVVNLFADMTYEGASSINGPFLGALGASAAAIGIISGVGEFLGYSLRIGAGYVSDKTGKYWFITFLGYGINLLAVPALALAGNWPLAAGLV